MKSVAVTFSGGYAQQVLDPAPSGSRYVVCGLTCTAGIVSALNIPTSGIIASANEGNAHTEHAYPSGNTGWAEAIEIVASAACEVTLQYILQVPNDKINDYHMTDPQTMRYNQPIRAKWLRDPLTGEYVN